MRWLLSRSRGNGATAAKLCHRLSRREVPNGCAITFINHSTFLIQLKGINILTDPIWSERASPLSWIGPRRHRAPGIPMEHLPPIDLVLLSHDHYDHMDLPTLRRLARRASADDLCRPEERPHAARHGIGNIVELDWWQEAAARQ